MCSACSRGIRTHNALLTRIPHPSCATHTEWTSFHHPDPTGEQLRCMQKQVLKMLEGSAADVDVSFADKIYLPVGTSVSRAEWKRLLDAGHVFIWLDYSSVPVSRGYTTHKLDPRCFSKSVTPPNVLYDV